MNKNVLKADTLEKQCKGTKYDNKRRQPCKKCSKALQRQKEMELLHNNYKTISSDAVFLDLYYFASSQFAPALLLGGGNSVLTIRL